MATHQHYVPQWYLRRFSKNRRLWAYDKRDRVSRLVGYRGQCQRLDYYEIPNLLPTDFYWAGSVERKLSEYDRACANCTLHASQLAAGTLMTAEYAAVIAATMLLQVKRSPIARRYYEQLAPGAIDSAVAPLRSVDPVGAAIISQSLEKTTRPENSGYWHGIDLLHRGVGSMLRRLLHHRLVLVRAPGGTEFVTSDNPVVIGLEDDAGFHFRRPGIGMDSPGAMVVYPLSPQCALHLFQPDGLQQYVELHLRVVEAKPFLIERANALQLQQCARFVYSRYDYRMEAEVHLAT